MPDKLLTPEALSSNLQEFDACIHELSRKIALGEVLGLEFVSEAFGALGVSSFVQQKHRTSVELNGGNSDEDTTLVCFSLNSTIPGTHSRQKHLQNLLPAGIGICLATFIARYGGAGRVRIVFDECAASSGAATEGLDAMLQNVTRSVGVSCDLSIPAGCVAVKFGVIHPRFDRLVIELVKDRSSPVHSDLVEVAGHVVTSLTQITVRKINPLKPARIAFDALDLNQAAAGNTNKLILTGTIGAMSESVIDEIGEIIQRTLQALAVSCGVDCNCSTEAYQPPLHGDVDLTTQLKETAVAVLGTESTIELAYSTQDLTGLAAYLERTRGTVLFVGSHILAPASEASVEMQLPETLRASLKVLYGFLHDLRAGEGRFRPKRVM